MNLRKNIFFVLNRICRKILSAYLDGSYDSCIVALSGCLVKSFSLEFRRITYAYAAYMLVADGTRTKRSRFCLPLPLKNDIFHHSLIYTWRVKHPVVRIYIHCLKYYGNCATDSIFCTTIKTIKYLSWVVRIYASQIQCGGWPPS